MKKLIRTTGYVLATLMVLLISQLTAFAADGPSNQGSSLTGMQVFGGFALLVLVILLPILKKSNKREIIR